ncbi:DNA-binding transcriptional regulator, GntR family [Mycolicibacterium rutilum]|uniref:DNA-binding transcriptional regulator, GntR family n=1 Tax=Mycolicibacterium rutilum TaxID=370526 RepID=A0A1H6LK26_MYCRU|nr:GntR family transcriptional regulator [Mycolicibacterium rutilum]SEH86469.1 DNA-binding transcriptional regulator, GntR family [Mycolicibacterium rutilum]
MSDASSLADRVFVALRDDLMSGQLAPTERLAESSLAERYEVSRTPVREALARLLADGLIERRERGLYPYRPSIEDLDHLYELRTTVELRGIARIEEDDSRRHDRDILGPELDHWKRLRRNVPRPDAGFVSEDERFHVALLSAAGNQALVAALELVNVRIRPVRMFDYLTEDRMLATIDEHIAVAERVVDGDLAAARDALSTHIEASRRVAIRRATEALSMAGMIRALRS